MLSGRVANTTIVSISCVHVLNGEGETPFHPAYED